MKRLLLAVILIFSFSDVFAQKLDYSGFGAAGIRFYDRNILNGVNQETFYEGKIQAELKYNDEIEAQLDLRGNSVDNSMEFREFSVKFEYYKYMTFKVGNIKRPFGYEYLMNRENLWLIDRSVVQNEGSQKGFGTRTISFMMYHKYKKSKKDEFPYTYYLSFFKDNAQVAGFAAHGRYHYTSHHSTGLSYMIQSYGGETPVTVNGFTLDYAYDSKKFHFNTEFLFMEDPVEIQIRELAGIDENVTMTGGKIMAAYNFDLEGRIFRSIEPVMLAGIFFPDMEESDSNLIQFVLGFNLYLDKKVRARFNGDLRLTKNEFNEDYTTKESRGVFEIQVRF